MANNKSKFSTAELKQIAYTMPKYALLDKEGKPLTYQKQVKGSSALVLGIKKGPNGEIIKASDIWRTDPSPLLVDHLKRLSKAYKQNGEQGIRDYIVKAGVEYRAYVEATANTDKEDTNG